MQARLRTVGVPNRCAVHGPKDERNPVVQLYVATADGYFYEYSLNVKVGGECKLERVSVPNCVRLWFELIISVDDGCCDRKMSCATACLKKSARFTFPSTKSSAVKRSTQQWPSTLLARSQVNAGTLAARSLLLLLSLHIPSSSKVHSLPGQ